MSDADPRAVFRFAPSPNGLLHLGHAYSALLNDKLARQATGRFLLRIEDVDAARSKPEYEAAIRDDLAWLGLVFPEPPRRQSEHGRDYEGALGRLEERGLVYRCFCTRGEVARASGGARDPDGAPLHRGQCRAETDEAVRARVAAGERPALRLDMGRAAAIVGAGLAWREFGEGADATLVKADPASWGDVVLRGKDGRAAYHLAVVVDDAIQAVSDVARGRDLYHATSVHRALQELLGLPAPRYRHHRLVRDASGAKMSKSAHSAPLAALRARGFSAGNIRAALGFGGDRVAALEAAIS